MKSIYFVFNTLALIAAFLNECTAQKHIMIRPVEIDDVLINPGMGFTTFQMFNGDNLPPNMDVLTDPNLEDYQHAIENYVNTGHPNTSIAYFRILWQFIEPREGEYRWDYIDKLLEIAHQRNQTLMLRIAPYKGQPGNDVPDWYRKYVGNKRDFAHYKWVVDPEDNLYDDAVFIPMVMPAGEYDLQIGIIDPLTNMAKIKLAIDGKTADGWYNLGKMIIQ